MSANPFVIVCLIIIQTISGASLPEPSGLDYSVIQATGKDCPDRDSCQSRGQHNPDSELVDNDWKKRNCFCDDDCAIYGDCCIDAEAYDQSDQMSSPEFECVRFKQYGDIYVKSNCPEDWPDSEVKAACENMKPDQDPFGSLPVTNTGTGFTYSNFYCSVCNRDSKDIQFWNPRLKCPSLSGPSFKNITLNYISQNLRYDSRKQQWGVSINVRGINVFHPCSIEPVIPSNISKKVRNCFGNHTVVDCPKGYTDSKVIELCHSYTALLFEPERTYRNVHCAICNDVALDLLSCHTFEIFARLNWQTTFDSFSFAVLFDIGGDVNVAVGQAKVYCSEGQLYDPFFKKCRNIVCGSDKKMNERGICTDAQIGVKPTAKPTLKGILFTLSTTGSSAVKITTSSIPNKSTPSGSVIQTVPTAFTLPSSPSASSITTATGSTTVVASSILATSTTTILTTTTTETVLFHTTPSSSPGTPTQTPSTTGNATEVEEIPLTPTEIETIFVNLTEPAYAHTSSPTIQTDTESNHTKVSYKLEPEQEGFAYCPKFELAVEEFHIIDEKSVYIKEYDKTLVSDQFELVNNSLVFCASLAHGTNQIGKFDKSLSYVTIALISVSVFCLTLHLIVTFLTPDLQNISGKNLFSLSLALLGSYISFITAMFHGRNVELFQDCPCFALAVVMYFFFMASFFWMLVIAFDVCRALRLATTKLRLRTGSQWKKFLCYSLFAWIVPLVFAGVAVVVDTYKDLEQSEYRPGFGDQNLCWFSNKKALLIYFAVPFAVVMAFNIFLFIASAYIIFEASKSGEKMTSSSVPKVNFHLYLRLAIIMGLTWVIGLVAGFVNWEPFWYAFVVLNTLQGLFIFIAFTCNKKVITGLKDRIVGSSSGSSSTSDNEIGSTARLQRDFSWKSGTSSIGSVYGKCFRKNVSEKTAEKGGEISVSGPVSPVPSIYGLKSQTSQIEQ